MNSPIAPFDCPDMPDRGQQDLSYELATPSGDYLTQIDVNHVLGNLFQALAANRISSKRAGTLGYLCANILKSQEGMHDQASFLTWTAYDFFRKALHEKYGTPLKRSRNSPKPRTP